MIVLDIMKTKKKVKMFYLLDQEQNRREFAVDCMFGTFLLHVYINHSFTLQNNWWNVACLYHVLEKETLTTDWHAKTVNGQRNYRWRGKTDLTSVLTAVWQNQTMFLLNICYTALPFLKTFDISNTQNWNMEKKTGNIFQNTGLKKHRQELMNTANG